MVAYLIVQTRVTDPVRMEAYRALAPAAVEKYGGTYLSRGGAFEHLEGDWDVPRLVLLEFPSMEAARAFYGSPEYAEAMAARKGAAEFTMTLLEGT